MDELRYAAGWVPTMAPGVDDDEAEYGRESRMVWCAECGAEVYVTSATYQTLAREWLCDDCVYGAEA